MHVDAVLAPPLGCTTVVPSSQTVRFVASLEVSQSNNSDWIIELWYGNSGSPWTSCAFSPAPSSEITVHDGSVQHKRVRQTYSLDLPVTGDRAFGFTIRYRQTQDSAWIWAKERSGLGDGQVIFQSASEVTAVSPVSFGELFNKPDPGLIVESVASEISGVDLFNVFCTAPALSDCWSSAVVGVPRRLKHFYALVKLSSPWMGPHQGSDRFTIDKDALAMGYLRSDGRHVFVLGVSGLGGTTTCIRSEAGSVLLKSRNDSNEQDLHRAIIATGLAWKETVEAAFQSARALLSCHGIAGETASLELEPYWQESWYDGLGYCTWNSLGREISENCILEALHDLESNNICISTLIIDDNWQSLDNQRRWDDFEANANFPHGLSGLTARIRGQFRNIKHIAVWHSIIGYWEGISPDGWIASNYKCTTVKWHGGLDVIVVDESDVYRLYGDFYKFLWSSGIDCIKCDVQVSLDEFDHAADRKKLSHAYQDAFKINSLKYFQGRVIYCMAHIPDIFFHSLLPRTSPQVLIRNSDDFFPDIPSSHPWHIFANAMNSIFTSQLNCIPDWDMFQTTIPQHAVGRAISGGPIYITDTPGQHCPTQINSIVASSVRDPDLAIILRPAEASLPLDPYLVYNSNRLLKVWNTFTGSTFLAVFNISSRKNSELIPLSQFPGLRKGTKYVIRQQTNGRVFGPASTVDDGTLVAISLRTGGWELFTAVRVKELGDYSVGVLGLLPQLTGAAAVENWYVSSDKGGDVVTVSVKALGVLGFYVSDLEKRTINKLFMTLSGKPVPAHTVSRCKQDPAVLRVDILAAWKELDLSSGWANNATLEFFMN